MVIAKCATLQNGRRKKVIFFKTYILILYFDFVALKVIWGHSVHLTQNFEACERMHTPQGIEQVMDVTGLPGIIIPM